jgi:hypothetical protein
MSAVSSLRAQRMSIFSVSPHFQAPRPHSLFQPFRPSFGFADNQTYFDAPTYLILPPIPLLELLFYPFRIAYSLLKALTNSFSVNSAKRYERMMKAHGIAPNTSPGKISGQSSTNNGGSSKGSPAKKRKVADAIGSVDGDDEGKLGSGVQDEFSGENTINKKNNPERGDSGEGLEELAFATVEYGNGVSSSAGNQSGGEVHPQTGTLHIEDDGDAHESIVTD